MATLLALIESILIKGNLIAMMMVQGLSVGGRMQIYCELFPEAGTGEIPDAGFFSWGIPENIVYADSALANLFGIDQYEAGHGLPIATFLARVHPDDRQRLARVISRSITDHFNQQEAYRVRRGDGSYVKVESFAHVFRDRSQKPVRYVGIVIRSEAGSAIN